MELGTWDVFSAPFAFNEVLVSRRLPAVAGQFYSASPQALREEVERCQDPEGHPEPMLIGISPHAGLMYSGPVAGAVYARLAVPETVVLIGPNHTGLGPAVSVYPDGTWLMPGCEVPVDRSLAQLILSRFPEAEPDESAHRYEHCIEVQLPFLTHARQDLHIVPIVLGTTNPELCRRLGRALAAVIREGSAGDPSSQALILATTDMTHYEPDPVARERDGHAIRAIEALDSDRLCAEVRTHAISMCGLGPTVVAMETARACGATCASLVRYGTSGDVGGGRDRVVGYAGFVISKHERTA